MRCSLFALSQPISLHRIREVIESAPPLKVSEEREINSSGLKKKVLKRGQGWESWDTPEFGDEITVHYTLLDGTKLHSTKDNNKPCNFKLGCGLFPGFCYFEVAHPPHSKPVSVDFHGSQWAKPL
ncbi:peptidyl-prolyl cis-trans isomerase FKBP65-like isoform X2 [Actinidia eriantha]|uniref:peptidyl-prolyl cis-trans isomerase FKBP65-like isoform X2 n=1 Tax=Actinidia eriantha TaxID=165200 RepID=UPI002586766C|nr:peptidyl-prolyl cis-trans isomerase FKBP65-like isoform X2 [Actinidia eriantha]